MIVITAKEIIGIVCIAILIGIVLIGAFIDWSRKQGEKLQKKMWGIGEYDKEANEKNRTILIGKGDVKNE